MNREEALKLMRGGADGVAEWNRWREDTSIPIPDLSEANLRDVELQQINLSYSSLRDADLSGAKLSNADFSFANMHNTQLSGAHLECASFRDANLRLANLNGAYLPGASLWGANLALTLLRDCDLERALFGYTAIDSPGIVDAHNLETIIHQYRSFLSREVIIAARLKDDFLLGCGLTPWEIAQAKLYEPALPRDEFIRLQREVYNARYVTIGGVFISYSHTDAAFVDKIGKALKNEGANVWIDRENLLAGDIFKQVSTAIQFQDVVLLVLSKSSVSSDWVESELKAARNKEKSEGRDVLCPIALDDSWKPLVLGEPEPHPTWAHLGDKNILDFSKWKGAFDESFDKLVQGLRENYEVRAKSVS